MAVTIHCNGTNLSLVHKGNSGITKSTLPDVCKTPSPGGPVPIPYPIIVSVSGDLVKGSKTVKIDGGNMVAIKGSEFSRCTGDEPGTAGGVKSSTNMKEATWLLYSFDVKIEGKNACRLSDKMLMNHGNTACLGGHITKPVGLSPEDDVLADACMRLHDQYKETQDKYDKLANKDLKKKVFDKTATAAERSAYIDSVAQRCELTELLIGQRQAYVDMDCDKFAWVRDGQPSTETAAQRKARHVGEIAECKQQLDNAMKLLAKV